MSTIPIICVVGRSAAGKTTLLEKLIPELKSRGYRVGTIKHHAHPGFEIDHPGKDTWRHARAGSDHVVIAALDKIASVRPVDREPTLDEVAATISEVDLILTEGYKRSGEPKIEVAAIVFAFRALLWMSELPEDSVVVVQEKARWTVEGGEVKDLSLHPRQ